MGNAPSLQQELLQAIDTAAAAAYEIEASTLPNVSPDQISRMRRCRTVAPLMAGFLGDLLSGSEVTARVDIRYGLQVDEHRYPVLDVPDVGDVIADPTWKQFLPEGRSSDGLPDVLIGSRLEVVQSADGFGISGENQMLWQPIDSNPQPQRYLTPAERIARAYDDLARTALSL